MANQFLVKETMAAMRGLSAAEITSLQDGTYDGVQLLGYYQKEDTPAPIIYYNVAPSNEPGGQMMAGALLQLERSNSFIILLEMLTLSILVQYLM